MEMWQEISVKILCISIFLSATRKLSYWSGLYALAVGRDLGAGLEQTASNSSLTHTRTSLESGLMPFRVPWSTIHAEWTWWNSCQYAVWIVPVSSSYTIISAFIGIKREPSLRLFSFTPWVTTKILNVCVFFLLLLGGFAYLYNLDTLKNYRKVCHLRWNSE